MNQMTFVAFQYKSYKLEKESEGSTSILVLIGLPKIILHISYCENNNYEIILLWFINFSYDVHIGLCYFQVILQSEVKATLTINDAWLDLQDGFVHTTKGDGRPTSAFFPLVISPHSRAAILFSICLEMSNAEGILI